jgi:hypothetical protein
MTMLLRVPLRLARARWARGPSPAPRPEALGLALFTLAAIAAVILIGVVQTEAGHEAARWLGL